jgi:hypothetical protein
MFQHPLSVFLVGIFKRQAENFSEMSLGMYQLTSSPTSEDKNLPSDVPFKQPQVPYRKSSQFRSLKSPPKYHSLYISSYVEIASLRDL